MRRFEDGYHLARVGERVIKLPQVEPDTHQLVKDREQIGLNEHEVAEREYRPAATGLLAPHKSAT